MTEVRSPTRPYEIIKRVAEAPTYRLYLCRSSEMEGECLLQIADEPTNNGALDRNAFMLQKLAEEAERLERIYQREHADAFLNYGLMFPEFIETFLCPEQGTRRINILAIRNVECVSSVVPVSSLVLKDGLRVDLRTSAWMMGKLLKLLTFAHGIGISVGRVTIGNVLFEPKEHYILVFNWDEAAVHDPEVPEELRRTEIRNAAKVVIEALEGDMEQETFPASDGARNAEYTEFLLAIARGTYANAQTAHARFYDLIDGIWERAYYPFTALPRSNA